MINAKACPDHGLVVDAVCNSESRIEIRIVWKFQGRSGGTYPLATIKVEDPGSMEHLVNGGIIFPTQPYIDCQIRAQLPFVLYVGQHEGVTQPAAPPGRLQR